MNLDAILTLFKAKGKIEKLAGGQGTSMKIGNTVIKPVEDDVYYVEIMKHWSNLNSTKYRISKPVLSTAGKYVEQGYAATVFEPGIEIPATKVKQKLEVSRRLHADLKQLGVTRLPFSNDPWTKANSVLWRHEKLPTTLAPEILELCITLLSDLPIVEDDYQLIHADLGGNILFDDELEPLIIDFSPTIAPAPYADAIIVSDAIAYEGTSLESIKLLETTDYLKYAILFRILTCAFLNETNFDAVNAEWQAYRKIWDYLNNEQLSK